MTPLRLPALSFFLCLAAAFALTATAQTTPPVPVYSWTTLAGRASIGTEDGPAAAARFNRPQAIAMDATGNLFVADSGNHTIRKVTPSGVVSVLAGSAGTAGSSDGTGSAARFNGPQGVGVDPTGNVYVADTGNHTIRKITPGGVVTTIAGQAGKKGTADGAAGAALFDSPDRLTVDTNGNIYLYNNGVRKISGGQVVTLPISTKECPAVSATGEIYYVGLDSGLGALSVFKIDTQGNAVNVKTFVVPYETNYVGPIVNDVAGNIFVAHFTVHPPNSSYYIGHQILPDGTVTSPDVAFVTNIGSPTKPIGLAVDPTGHWLYTRDSDDAILGDHATTYAGTPRLGVNSYTGTSNRLDSARYLTVDAASNIWVAENPSYYSTSPLGNSTTLVTIDTVGLQKITPAGAVLSPSLTYDTTEVRSDRPYPTGLASDGAGNVYLGKYGGFFALSHLLQKVAPDNTVTTLKDLPGTSAAPYNNATALVAAKSGKLYTQNDIQILQQASDGTWSPFAGGDTAEVKDGTGSSAHFSYLHDLTIDSQDNLYGVDSLRNAQGQFTGEFFIRKITPAAVVTTVGKKLATNAGAVAVDSKGNIYLTHPDLCTITRLNAQGDEITIGGLADHDGSADGNGDQARFSALRSLRVDAQDNLYTIDGFGTTVRKGQYAGVGPLITTQPLTVSGTVGGTALFTVAATGTPAPTYQWYFGSTPLAGATDTSLSLPNLRTSDAGDYTVVATNSFGTATSTKATLMVGSVQTPPPPPVTGPSSGNSSGGGGGGGGSIGAWFATGLMITGFGRFLLRRK